MTGRGLRRATVVVALAALSFPSSVARANTSPSGKLSIEAKLSPEQVGPGDAATLTVEVTSEGLNLPEVPLPQIPNVAVERAGTAQNLSIMNGRVSRTSTTMYRIIPRKEGTVTIPSLRVTVGSETAETGTLTLIVSRGAAARPPTPLRGGMPPGSAPSGTPEIFVKASVDRSRVFWNEQVVLRLRLYSRIDVLGDVDWKPPSANGFWTEGLGPARQGRVRVNGVEYAVMEIPSALFPTRVGALTIGRARIRCRVARVIQPPDPWSMLAIPDVVPEDVTLDTDPVTVTVDPLPAGAPAGFEGAVGNYHLAVHVDALTAHAGEPVVARATITGTGNVSSIRDPEIRTRDASREYVVGTSTRVDRNGDRLGGEREHDMAFVADQPGTLEILPVRFVWFDPEARGYRWQSSEPVTVRIEPAAGGTETGRVAGQGLAPAVPRPGSGPRGSLSLGPSTTNSFFLGFSAIAFASAVLAGGARRRRSRDPRWARVRLLESLLSRELDRARSLAASGDPAKAAALAEQTLLLGTGLRYDVELTGLARAEREQTLRARRAGGEEIGGLERHLDALHAIAYAPPETRRSDAKQAVAATRRTLERYRREIAE